MQIHRLNKKMVSLRCVFECILHVMRMHMHTHHKKMVSLQCVFACALSNRAQLKMRIHTLHKKMVCLLCVFPCDFNVDLHEKAEPHTFQVCLCFQCGCIRKCFSTFSITKLFLLKRVRMGFFRVDPCENVDLHSSQENGFSLVCVKCVVLS